MGLDSKYFDRIRTRRKRPQEPEQGPPTCQWDGCDKHGTHRAPVGRNAEGQFFLFFMLLFLFALLVFSEKSTPLVLFGRF